MTTALLIAILASVAFAVTLLVSLLVVRARHSYARLDERGFQELEIVVKGKYRPDSVVVRRSIPVRLHLRRQEDTPCSGKVIFSDFHVGSRLPSYQTTTIYFVPTKCGEFLFTCEFGMYQGRLIVVEPSKLELAKIGMHEVSDSSQARLSALQAKVANIIPANDVRGEEVSPMANDPVCGMQVDEKKATAKAQYDGQTYYFCSSGCKSAFEKDPAK